MRISLEKEWDYILNRERSAPPEEQTVWRLRRLTKHDILAFPKDKVLHRGREILAEDNTIERNLVILERGVAGWKNLLDQNGAEIPATRKDDGSLPDEVVVGLDPRDWTELADAILEGATLTREEAKN